MIDVQRNKQQKLFFSLAALADENQELNPAFSQPIAHTSERINFYRLHSICH
jgi:hypothetical protein